MVSYVPYAPLLQSPCRGARRDTGKTRYTRLERFLLFGQGEAAPDSELTVSCQASYNQVSDWAPFLDKIHFCVGVDTF